MKIFVTGGTGFIGKFLLPKLNKEKNELLILTRNPNNLNGSKNIAYVEGDLSNIDKWKDEVEEFKPEAAIHLAWEGIPDYSSQNSIKNLKYSLDLIQLLAKVGCRKILATGSLWEYGEQEGKLSEEMQVIPFNAFAVAKNSLNWMGTEFAKENNMIFLWTRLFYVYGPGQKNNSLIPYLISCTKMNKRPKIRNPNAQNDFIYVEDVADAICKIVLKCRTSEVFNIGSGKLTSVQYIIEKIFNSLGIKAGIKIGEKEQLDSLQSAYADISKIRKETGWVPKVNIDEGIKKTLEAFVLI